MSETETPAAKVTIRAIRFETKYVPLRPTEENPKPDPNAVMGEDWVTYCSPGNAAYTTIDDAVHRLKRDKSGKWASIAPAYEAWKLGTDVPTEGTPLGAWAGCSQAQAAVLKASGIRTVEEVAGLTETLLTRIKLPNPRALKDQANQYLEARSGVAVEEAIRKRDDEIALLRSQMEDMMALLKPTDEDGEPVKNKGGRPRKVSEEA